MKIYKKVVIDIESGNTIESDSYDYDGPLALANPSGGGGGSSNDMKVTNTTTNPVVPNDMKALADSMNAVATGGMGAPANFGPIPGLDAPSSGPLIPQPSMGNMLASTPFQMGANRMGVNGGMMRPRPMGRMTRPMPRSWGDLFAMNGGSGGGSLGSYGNYNMPAPMPKPPMPTDTSTVAPQPSQADLARIAGAA